MLVKEIISLEGLPFEIFVTSDGEKAIDFINRAETDQDAPCPQFVLLDLNLPKKHGFEVLRRLRESEKCKHVPVLIMTSSDSPADQSRAAELGAGYFRKPADYDEYMKLGEVLKQLMKDSAHN